jgi:hypothetical protein
MCSSTTLRDLVSVLAKGREIRTLPATNLGVTAAFDAGLGLGSGTQSDRGMRARPPNDLFFC